MGPFHSMPRRVASPYPRFSCGSHEPEYLTLPRKKTADDTEDADWEKAIRSPASVYVFDRIDRIDRMWFRGRGTDPASSWRSNQGESRVGTGTGLTNWQETVGRGGAFLFILFILSEKTTEGHGRVWQSGESWTELNCRGSV